MHHIYISRLPRFTPIVLPTSRFLLSFQGARSTKSWHQWKRPQSELLFQGRDPRGELWEIRDIGTQMDSGTTWVVDDFQIFPLSGEQFLQWFTDILGITGITPGIGGAIMRHHAPSLAVVAYLIWLNSGDDWLCRKIYGDWENPVV